MKAILKLLLLLMVVNLVSCGNKVPLKLPENSLYNFASYERN
tara:strand:+ start:879 stop:1004 length:126 start_codon:yes stop_codon:yes gene_type:complete